MVKEAAPPDRVTVARIGSVAEVPSLKVIEPVAVEPTLVTLALKVTLAPDADGFDPDVRESDIVLAYFTTCVIGALVLPRRVVFPA